MKAATDWLNTYQKFWGDTFEALARHIEGERQ